MIISSQNVDHMELTFLVFGDPYDKAISLNSPFLPLEFNLRNSDYTLNLSKEIPAERDSQLYVYERSILVCSSRVESHVYNPSICDLTKKMNWGDTIVYESRNHLFSS